MLGTIFQVRLCTLYIVQTLQDSWKASKRCGIILSTRLQVSHRHVWVRFNSRRSNSWFSVIAASLQILIFLSNYSWQILSWAFPCTYVLRQNSQKTFWHQWGLDLIHRQLVSSGKRWVKSKCKVLYKCYCSNQGILQQWHFERIRGTKCTLEEMNRVIFMSSCSLSKSASNIVCVLKY